MKVINNETRLIIKSWCENPEQGCVDQAMNLANLPFAFKHVALMPDTHQGYGMPIGGVLATKGVVIPNAVGVDIGCGMHIIKFSLKEISTDNLKAFMGECRKLIPVGFSHRQAVSIDKMTKVHANPFVQSGVCGKEYDNARTQIGTLGGGNHFIEVQMGSDGHVYVMIHSGSRNLGKQVAEYYNDEAKQMNAMWHSSVTEKMDLAFLPTCDFLGQAYLAEMTFCLDFAKDNRQMMANIIKGLFADMHAEVMMEFDIHHNYAAMEHHFGENVMVHRKGATRARVDELGLIPGSQGTASYIVRGKGNADSFMSCSHGAGRRMGRKEASRKLNLDEEIKKMNDKGIIHGLRTVKDLDESASAYKDIDLVMKEQEDLVGVEVSLRPLAVIKG